MTYRYTMPVLRDYPASTRLGWCRDLFEFAEGALVRPVPQRDGGGHRMLLSLWAQAHTTYGAVLRLAEVPDGASAAMLSRALFEAAVDAHWIAANGRKAELQATSFIELLKHVTVEQMARTASPGDPQLPALTPGKRIDDLNQRFGTRAQRHWTELDLVSRIRAVEQIVPQDEPRELMHRYEEDNFLANQILHGSPMAMNDRLSPAPHGVTIAAGPTSQHVANALRHAYWSYYRITRAALDRDAPDRRDDLITLYRTAWPRLQTVTEGALKAVGRNGQCPCGSGAKVKTCHGAT